MAQKSKQRGALHIDVNNEGQLQEWSRKLDVGHEELCHAIGVVGPDVEALRQHFGRPQVVTEIEPQDRTGEFEREEI